MILINGKYHYQVKDFSDFSQYDNQDAVVYADFINEDGKMEQFHIYKDVESADEKNVFLYLSKENTTFFSKQELEKLSDILMYETDEGPIGSGWKSAELEQLSFKIGQMLENLV